MTTMYNNDATAPVKDSPKESGIAILFDYSFFQSLKDTATILAKDTAELVTKGILPELSTSHDAKADATEERARRAAEIIARDPYLGKQEDQDEILKMIREAKKDGTEGQLLAAINKELDKQGSHRYLRTSEQHEINPHTGDDEFFETLNLVSTQGRERTSTYIGLIDSHTQHRGRR